MAVQAAVFAVLWEVLPMKAKQAKIFAVCMIAICLIITVLYFAKISMNAAATAGSITFAIAASNTATSAVCGNGVCEAGENCAIDCNKNQAQKNTGTTTQQSVYKIKLTSFMLILLIMIFCALAYIYLKEDKRTANGYWQYGFQRS
jgi:preprotein translocase subunit SecG